MAVLSDIRKFFLRPVRFSRIKAVFLDLSLQKKLMLMMIVLNAMLLTILFFFYWQSEKTLLSRLADHTSELSKAIQIGVEEVTGAGTDQARLGQYLRELKSRGIKEISIIDTNEEIIASSSPEKIGSSLSPRRKELVIQAELGEPVSSEGKTYNVILPVIAGDTHYGYIHLKINEDDFSELLRRSLIRRIGAAIFVFTFGLVVAMVLSQSYTRPINQLREAVGKVAAGDFEQKLVLARKDEIGSLTESFNTMVERLKLNKRLEERLREAEHLSAVGQLSRSMAHEIRNPLNFISLSIDYIRDNYMPAEPVSARNYEKLISGIKQEVFRLDRLVNDFLDYGKPLGLNTRRLNMNDIFQDVVGLIRAKADSQKVSISEDYGRLPQVLADPELMKSCIYNIVLNAFQSMPGGGGLSLSTRAEGSGVRVSISDTGVGVPEENLQKIFEPFFSTKGGGLGLGLATTKRIVEEHGGRISLESRVGKGSVVAITLPGDAPAPTVNMYGDTA